MKDPVVRKETVRIAVGTLALSAVMQLVFVLVGHWSVTVLIGNLIGAFAAILNFYLMCLTVVRCVGLEKDKAAMKIRASQGSRLLMLAAFVAVGAFLPYYGDNARRLCNLLSVAIPLLFPRIVIMVYQLTHGKDGSDAAGSGAGNAEGNAPGGMGEGEAD